jgi:hypothetical protein
MSGTDQQRAIWRRIHILSDGETRLARRLANEYCLYQQSASKRSRLRDFKRRYLRLKTRLAAAWDELHASRVSA